MLSSSRGQLYYRLILQKCNFEIVSATVSLAPLLIVDTKSNTYSGGDTATERISQKVKVARGAGG
ncbi:MAG: hypothetical protein P8L49_01870 [Opitutaceae bacterium]|nr:hypothetical protein [Opitutaceae bacterium]